MSFYPTDQRCPRCQYPITPGAQTCSNCGLALSSAPQTPYGSEPPPPPPPPYGAAATPSSPYGPPPGSAPYGGNSGYGGGTAYDFTPQPPPPPVTTPSYYPGSQPQPGFPSAPPTYVGSQPQPGFPPPLGGQPPARKRSGGLKAALIILVILIILGAGGGVAAYLLTRPKPAIDVTSDYKVGSTPAGSTSTVLHVTGQKFSGSSNVTFLLDSQPAPDVQTTVSDGNGNIKADLTITDKWGVGQHVLTARDASNYTTQQGITVSIVPQGQAHTPGPNGSPTDDASPFTINLRVTASDGSFDPFNDNLTVTSTNDAGKQVCNPKYDDGAPHSFTSSANDYTETYTWSCTGSYKGGKLTYTETSTKDQIKFTNGVTCTAQVPYVFEHLEGSFTSSTAINGTYSADAITYACTNGNSQQFDATTGTWTGTAG